MPRLSNQVKQLKKKNTHWCIYISMSLSIKMLHCRQKVWTASPWKLYFYCTILPCCHIPFSLFIFKTFTVKIKCVHKMELITAKDCVCVCEGVYNLAGSLKAALQQTLFVLSAFMFVCSFSTRKKKNPEEIKQRTSAQWCAEWRGNKVALMKT